jgi:hypothetical protein
MWHLSMRGFMFIAKARLFMLLAALLPSQVACGQTPANRDDAKSSPTPVSSAATRQKSYPNLKEQAERWAEAYVREDYEKVASLTLPKQVELMGGSEGMARILTRSLEGGGVKMLSIQVGEPEEVIPIERQLFAIVPTTLKMREPRGVVVGNGFLIGVSNDGGETWTFVDGSGGRNEEKVKTLLPAAAGKLKLPELKPLVLETKP